MRDRNLDRFDVQPLREVNRIAQRIAGFARQPDDKIAVDQQAELVAVRREPLGHVDRRALLNVPENLLITRLIPDDQQPAAGVPHRL